MSKNPQFYNHDVIFDDSKFVMQTGPEVIKLFSCSSQLSIKFLMLIRIKISRNLAFLGSDKPKMLSFPLILTFMSNCWHFNIYEQEKFHTRLS